MTTTSIRIDRATHARLKRVAAKERLSLRETVDMLLNQFGKDEFEKREAVLLDGLQDEPSFDDTDGADKR